MTHSLVYCIWLVFFQTFYFPIPSFYPRFCVDTVQRCFAKGGKVASVTTFKACIDVLTTCTPKWALFENVASIEREVDDDTQLGPSHIMLSFIIQDDSSFSFIIYLISKYLNIYLSFYSVVMRFMQKYSLLQGSWFFSYGYSHSLTGLTIQCDYTVVIIVCNFLFYKLSYNIVYIQYININIIIMLCYHNCLAAALQENKPRALLSWDWENRLQLWMFPHWCFMVWPSAIAQAGLHRLPFVVRWQHRCVSAAVLSQCQDPVGKDVLQASACGHMTFDG